MANNDQRSAPRQSGSGRNGGRSKTGKGGTGPTAQMRRRATFIMIILTVFCFSAIAGKLAILQLVEGDAWSQRATAQQLSDTAVDAKRGTIYDANLNILAASADVWQVILSPSDILDRDNAEEVRVKVATELSELLELDYDTVYEKTGKAGSKYEVVKTRIEYEMKEQVSAWILENSYANICYLLPDYKRYYPYDNLLSTVLGFTGTDNNGLEGLEAAYDDVLSGTPGRIVTAENGVGDELPTDMEYAKIVDAEDGHNLVLTVDVYIQSVVEKYLEEAIASTGTINRGCSIVMDVNTGAILAMAVKGDYNPNEPFTITDPDTQLLLADLAQSEDESYTEVRNAALQQQWNNKTLTDTYEPGSVFKIFTGCMALEEGVANLNTSWPCNAGIRVKGWNATIKCHTSSHGTLNFSQALSGSCNPYFIHLGLLVGGYTYFDYFSAFGFTAKTGIDTIGEASNAGLYHSASVLASESDQSSLATTAFGQTFKVTPLQMITAVSAVANGGKLMKPYLIKEVVDGDGNVVEKTTPTVVRQVVSEQTAATMAGMMAESVNGGGTKNAYVAGYRVAGKTGTSEKRDTPEDDVVSSTAVFAPADDAQIAILTMLDTPTCSVQYGGTIVAPVQQKILADVLPYLGVEPQYTDEELSKMNITTPKVTGMTLSTAQNTLTSKGLTYKSVGSGDTVVKQVPESGTSIPKNGMVILYTEDTESRTVTVPDFTGSTVAEANRQAANLGLNLKIEGLSSNTTDVPSASGQSVPAGTVVEMGTIVEVNFIYADTIA